MIERTYDPAGAPDDRFCEIMTSLVPHVHARTFAVSSPCAPGDILEPRGLGEPCLVTGRVVDAAGDPVAAAHIDIWQAAADGFNDVQRPGDVPARNPYRPSTAGSDGRFWFRAIVPSCHPMAAEDPVEWLLNATGRQVERAAHIHVKVSSPGIRTLTTRLHVTESSYLGSAAFGAKVGLIREFTTVYDQVRAAEYGLPNPYLWVHLPITVRRGGSDD